MMRDNELDELKPCPFCGSRDVAIKQQRDMMGTPYYSTECRHCRMLAGDYYGAREAASNWNRREEMLKEGFDKDNHIDALEAENATLKTILSDIVSDAIDMGHYYHVRYEDIERASGILKEDG